MKKVAVFFANGFEEIEALTVVDILRRVGIHVDMVGVKHQQVTGAHSIVVSMDRLLKANMFDYDMLILPGGMPGATHLKENETVVKLVHDYVQTNRYVAAICAAPIVLGKAQVLKEKAFTAYPGFEEEILASNVGSTYTNELVTQSGCVITAKGAGAAFEFAYRIAEVLGVDTQDLRESMMYQQLID